MAWPDDRDLPIDVDAAFGADVHADPGTWSWTGLSSRLRAVPISLRAGKSGSNSQVSPGTCAVTLVNDDAALTPLHPVSPYWPNVELGTPVRVRLRRVEDAFGRTTSGNSWGTADSGEAWSVGGSGASVSGGVARHSHTDVGNVRTTTQPVSLTDSEQVVDVAPSALLTGAALVTGFVFRHVGGQQFYWLRCEFNAGGTTVMLKISRYTAAGGYVDLATLNPVPSLTYAANTYLRVRASVVGTRMAIKVWPAAGTEPAGWQLTATDSVITAPGKVGLQSWLVGGNSNTLPVVAQHKGYTVYVDRFSGHADQWEPTYIPTGVVGEMASAVRITASGILRRVQQGAQAALSPLRRTIAASNPVAYWPGEDGVLASQAGSATSGAAALAVTGTVEFTPVGDYTIFTGTTTRYGTTAVANLKAGGGLRARLTPEATALTAAAWTVGVVMQVDTLSTLSADVVVMEWETAGGTYARWQLKVTTTSRTQVIGITSGGSSTLLIDTGSATPEFAQYAASASITGGTVTVTLYRGNNTPVTTTFGGTLGGVSSMAVNPTGATSTGEMPAGHLAVWAVGAFPLERGAYFDSYGGLVREVRRSWLNEAATDRLARVCAEDGIALNMPAVPADAVQRMSWQPTATSADLRQECEAVDGGLLYESGFGLGYLPRSARYNQPTTLTIDLATYAVEKGAPSPLVPVYDDQIIRNEWTVERREGSFAVASDPTSQRRGVYADSVELNLAADDQLPGQAAWRVHLTREPDLREQTFPIDLAANPDLLDGWLSCQVGSRIVRTNPPAQHRPGAVDRLVMGWTETIGPRSWLVQVVPAQAKPWDVATADGPQRAAADGSALGSALGASGMTAVIASTPENGPWTQNPANFPLDIRVGGEQVTASAIQPGLRDNFGRTTPGWGNPDIGPAWVAPVSGSHVNGALGVFDIKTPSHATCPSLHVDFDIVVRYIRLTATPSGNNAEFHVEMRYVDAANLVAARLFATPSGSLTFNIESRSGGVAVPASPVFPAVPGATATTAVSLQFQGRGNVLRLRVWPNGQSPPDWQHVVTANHVAVGSVRLTGEVYGGNTNVAPYWLEWDGIEMSNPQVATLSARGVNGVQRAWPAGTEVNVWQPAVAGL
ncbi:hypothetical protein [Micromonospora taraxaci]|uniref:hypothetical protein n=1 Tax=Micromonospora taraxaci TaxID=1316803 RepID=UPI0033AA1BEF